MKRTSDVRVYKKFGPGYFISEQLKINKMTKAILANKLDLNCDELNDIMLNKTPVSTEIAVLLAKTFNTTSVYWKNIDIGYRIWLQEVK